MVAGAGWWATEGEFIYLYMYWDSTAISDALMLMLIDLKHPPLVCLLHI